MEYLKFLKNIISQINRVAICERCTGQGGKNKNKREFFKGGIHEI